MVSRGDYSGAIVEAARSVLLELIRILGEYQDDIVVVGGWVPELSLDQTKQKHVGSIDVDLAINHQSITEDGYKTILEYLTNHGYSQGKQPFIFHRRVVIGDQEIVVQVDFLAGEYSGTGWKHRTQKVQDMHPRKTRGVDLAFQDPEIIKIRGVLPNGGEDAAIIQVASIATFIIMKAFAMQGRLKEKDAWDIYYCLNNYPGGMEGLIQELHPLVKLSLVQEALSILADKFSSPSAVGPTHVADFDEITDQEERERIQRDAFERVQYFLEGLGVEDIR
jgi:hypothetical protein